MMNCASTALNHAAGELLQKGISLTAAKPRCGASAAAGATAAVQTSLICCVCDKKSVNVGVTSVEACIQLIYFNNLMADFPHIHGEFILCT
jgi:Na+/phosphate symporter